jgi:membrane fusion protein, multidrug efflux system
VALSASLLLDRRLFLAALVAACSPRPESGMGRVPVSVARAARQAVPFEITAPGTVQAIRTVAVTSQVSGMLLRVHFAEGAEVARGQVLFEIDPRPFAAAAQQSQANLTRDLVQAQNAARDAERYRTLAQDKFVTDEDYQQRQATAEALAATVQADSAALTVARLNLEYATIRAPVAGRTGSLLVHEGNLVRPSEATPLVTINQIRPILVQFALPAAQLPALQQRSGRPMRVLARAAQDSAVFEGDLSFVDNHVDSSTGTVLLKGRFPNVRGRLWPGELVDVTLILAVQADALVIPAQAVITAQQGTYVFVVQPDGSAKQQPVTVARLADTLAVIADGLEPGAVVVTDGQLRLTPEARVEIRGGPRAETDPAAGPR